MRIIISFTVFFLLLLSACSPVEEKTEQADRIENTENQEQQPEKEQNNDKQKDDQNETDTVSAPNGEKVLRDYKQTFMTIVDNTTDRGEVVNYESKDQLIDHFKEIMSAELANWYADTYFKEESNRLFIIPKDAPTWLKEDQPFEQTKIGDEKYQVIQERNNEMLGHVKMIYTLTFKAEKWIITDIKMEDLNQKSDESISKLEAEMLVRKHLQLEADEDVHIVYDHDENSNYVIHVFDVVGEGENSHTATRGWYYVDKSNGEITNMKD